jgi:thioredoxin-dependent peroxiredoxin
MARKPSAKRPKKSSKPRKSKPVINSKERRSVTTKAKGSASRKKVASAGRPKAGASAKARAAAPARAQTRPLAKPKSAPAAKSKIAAKPKAALKPAVIPSKPGLKNPPPGKSRAPMKGTQRSGNGMQGSLDFETEPSMSTFRAEHALPPMPTRRRSAAKPGSPDWPGESLTVGMMAPEFSLPSTQGRKVTLSEFRGKRVVLYFYPKDDTPGCTMEACAFRDHLPRIQSKDAVVLGISLDDELSHQRFAQKYNLPFPLLSDVDAAVSRQYGTYKEKNLYGRTYWGIERTTFVIDREGRVENVFRRVKVEGHAEEVMATLAL